MPQCGYRPLRVARYAAGPGFRDGGVDGFCPGRIRFEITDHLQHLERAFAVHHAVVKFLQIGDLAVLQSLDQPDLPQWFTPIQMGAVQVRGDFAECGLIAWLWQCNTLEVVIKTEVFVRENTIQDRVSETEGHGTWMGSHETFACNSENDGYTSIFQVS